MASKEYYGVLDEIAAARTAYSQALGVKNGAHNVLVDATTRLEKATKEVLEAEQRLNALELKLRAVMAGDTTTIITVPPAKEPDPEEIGRFG